MTSLNPNPFNAPDAANPGAGSGSAPAPGRPTLHVDSDWKAQAQAEKERLAKRETEREKERPAAGGEELPPADFRALVGVLASQAIAGLGAYGDSRTGRVIVDLASAKFAIDLLGIVEEKTKGNLDAEETSELREVLAELRSRFVQFVDLMARQQAAGGPAAAGLGGMGGAAGLGPQLSGGPGMPMSGLSPDSSAKPGPKLHIP